jgi:transcriptional regulator with XRE-family HTH domain
VKSLEVYERIRHLRKNVLKQSQEEFGNMLGVNRSVIKNIELNLLARPEQKEPLIKLICKEFNVSYEWLSTGRGDMRVETVDDFVERFAAETGIGYYVKSFIRCYLNLGSEQRAVLDGVLRTLAEMWSSAPGSAEPLSVVKAVDMVAQRKRNDASIDVGYDAEEAAFLEMARQQFRAEKENGQKASSVKESDAG